MTDVIGSAGTGVRELTVEELDEAGGGLMPLAVAAGVGLGILYGTAIIAVANHFGY